jgi:hypothetical protein
MATTFAIRGAFGPRMDPVWHKFEVDGETYYWRTYPSQRKVGDGPIEAVENIDVRRNIDAPAVGNSYPQGTVVTQENAVELVRLMKDEGHEFP